jgi:CDP-glucose 4,6-dehydratase
MEMKHSWIGKNVFVTGATGLVGSILVRTLTDFGANVSALIFDSPADSELVQSGLINELNLYNGNLSDYQLVSRALVQSEPDYIFHLGAQTIVGKGLIDPKGTFETNVQGTWNILEAARNFSPQLLSIVVASSDKAYGEAKILPYDESFPLHGDGPYDVSKSCTDLISQSYGKTYNLPVSIARCGNIYGPGDTNWSRIVPGTFHSLLTKQTPVLRSDGTFLRDYIFVKDVVDAYLVLALKQADLAPGEAFNFSHDRAYSVLEIYSEICQVVLQKYLEPMVLNSVTHEIHDQHLTSSKAKEKLGWEAKYSLESGLKESLPWYRELIARKVQQ